MPHHDENFLRTLSPTPSPHNSVCENCKFVDDEAPTEAEVEARHKCAVCGGTGTNKWGYRVHGVNQKCYDCGRKYLPTTATRVGVNHQKIICLNCLLNLHAANCACGDPDWISGDP
jgi:formylmethanofuran dehydrogenase subunit E